MAGDWIKVEKGGGNKPETLKIARMLGVSRREAYGLLIEFWEWLDTNCVDGVVDGVVDADVDALMTCPGLSALLKVVGWVRFDESPPRMIVTNFDRHNGETSKNRALRNARQAKWRENVDGHVDAPPSTKASTREEKRREEKRINLKIRDSIATPTSEHQDLAKQLGIDCDAEWAKYRDQQANAKGPRKHSDLEAGFRNWLKRASEFRPPPRPARAGDAKAAVTAEIWKRERDDEPTDITGSSKRVA